MPERDCYAVLGVPKSANREAIRRAFRRLARKLHPDVSALPDAEERFRELSVAYSVLSNPRARSLYDRFGYRGRGNGFGSRRRSASSAPILAEVELDTFDAARGTRREVRYTRREHCVACSGERVAPGSETGHCETCGGTGRLRVSSGLGVAHWLQVEECPDCGGERAPSKHCPECEGAGSVTEERVVNVRIPPGVEDGTRLRIIGEPQDEHLLVRVRPLPEDSRLVRTIAAVLLVCAVALFVYFVFKSVGATA